MGPLEKMGPKFLRIFETPFYVALLWEGPDSRSDCTRSRGKVPSVRGRERFARGRVWVLLFASRLSHKAVGPNSTSTRAVGGPRCANTLPMHSAYSLWCPGVGHLQSAHAEVIWRPHQTCAFLTFECAAAQQRTTGQHCPHGVTVRPEHSPIIGSVSVNTLNHFPPTGYLFGPQLVALCSPAGAGWRKSTPPLHIEVLKCTNDPRVLVHVMPRPSRGHWQVGGACRDLRDLCLAHRWSLPQQALSRSTASQPSRGSRPAACLRPPDHRNHYA
jgi:hypothetical protein